MNRQNDLQEFPLQNESNGIQRQWQFQFLNPYLQLFSSIVLTAAGQIFLKIGVDIQPSASSFGFLVSLWIWAGICAILASLFSWLYALKFVPMIVAFNLAATNHIFVAIGAWAFLGEKITQQRWLGICLVTVGAFFIARPSVRAEEAL
jgi:drug/metabolite transporter (DMT)-like permease